MPPVLHRQAEAGRYWRPGRALRAPLRRPREEEVEDRQRQALLQVKVRVLVRGRWGDAERRFERFPGGAALVDGSVGWVLVDQQPARALGRGLLWANRFSLVELHLLAGEDAGVLARRAAAFRTPPRVWEVEDTELRPASPAPLSPASPLDPGVAALADELRAAGAEPVVEHGVLRGEVLGLEVARVVVDEHGPYVEVGVGKHDRHAQRLVHGDEPTGDALPRAVATVTAHRRSDAPHHPLNRLAPERWLRARLVAEPALVGASQLAPVPSPVDRDDLRQSAPAPAAGTDLEGRPLLVVCSTGIDVDLVPTAVDARLADGRDPRLVLVVPERDDHPYLRPLASALREPAEVMTMPDNWRRP